MPVFISYRHTDRKQAFVINERLNAADITTYLDVLDEESTNGTDEITDVITKRMGQCTHLIAIISEDTSKSWWVPFEIGEATYADNRIATYQVNVYDHQLPSYLMKWPKMKSMEHLDNFIFMYKRDHKLSVSTEGSYSRDIYKAAGHTTTADDFHRILKQKIG